MISTLACQINLIILLLSIILQFQNVVMFIMSAFQLSLFAIYPNKGPVAQKGDKKKKK